jgi:hypothetical protein
VSRSPASRAEPAIVAAYPAVIQMHGAVKRDGRIETQERAPEAIDYSAARQPDHPPARLRPGA